MLVGQTEEEHSRIEVYVYEEDQKNAYVHHEILVGGMPLCVEWMDYDPGQPEAPGVCAGLGVQYVRYTLGHVVHVVLSRSCVLQARDHMCACTAIS